MFQKEKLMAVRKRKNEKSKSETKNDDKSDQNIQEPSSKLSIICLGKLVDPLTFTKPYHHYKQKGKISAGTARWYNYERLSKSDVFRRRAVASVYIIQSVRPMACQITKQLGNSQEIQASEQAHAFATPTQSLKDAIIV